MCLGDRERGLGIAVKVEDGAKRAIGPAVLDILRQVGSIHRDEVAALQDELDPAVTNTREEIVGDMRTALKVQGEFGP